MNGETWKNRQQIKQRRRHADCRGNTRPRQDIVLDPYATGALVEDQKPPSHHERHRRWVDVLHAFRDRSRWGRPELQAVETPYGQDIGLLRKRRPRWTRVSVGIVCLFFWISLKVAIWSVSHHDVPVLIHVLEPTGGAPRPKFPSFSTLRPLAKSENYFFGFLDIRINSLENVPLYEFRRYIRPSDEEEFVKDRDELLDEMDEVYVDIKYLHDDELDYSECQRPSWHDLYYSNCNTFHEIDLSRSNIHPTPNFDVEMFSHGWFRDVWRVSMDGSDPLVLKTTRYEHDFDHRFITKVQRDATVMIVLASSPRIIDIRGACAASVSVAPAERQLWDDFLPHEKFVAEEHEQYYDPKDLHDEADVRPMNNLTVTQKVEYALSMAEAISELHGYDGGVIVHDDMTPDQWLVNNKGEIILGDFNRALVLEYNVEEEKYCKFDDGRGFGFYRSPEEKQKKIQDEKIDVYSFGSQMYAILTGLRPFYADLYEVARLKIRRGIRPFLDDRYCTRSYGEGELVKIIELCWEPDPDKRTDIFEVVRRLRRVRDELHKRSQPEATPL